MSRGLALERCRTGYMPAAIAEEFRLPLDLVRSWIDEEQRRPPQQALAVMEMLKHANLDFYARRCLARGCAGTLPTADHPAVYLQAGLVARCGGELGFDIPISSWGNDKFWSLVSPLPKNRPAFSARYIMSCCWSVSRPGMLSFLRVLFIYPRLNSKSGCACLNHHHETSSNSPTFSLGLL